MSHTSSADLRERTAWLAYEYWQRRCCPIGSPGADWFAMEQALTTLDAATETEIPHGSTQPEQTLQR